MADDNSKETHMTIKIDPDRMFALLGEHGEHWVQGTWGDDTGLCLHGAIRRCSPQPGDAFLIEQVAARFGWGTDWNDDEGTDWSMVRDRIIAGIEVTDEMLAVTFGPQWEPIVALVRRAAVLSEVEERGLDAVRAAVQAAVRDAAWDAAWDAARDAARDAAWAARDAAWAAWAAAGALATRDLIGQHGYTQAHYDLLTRPWATVIGPVHPDDQEANRG